MLLLPPVERLLGDRYLADQIRYRHPNLRLPSPPDLHKRKSFHLDSKLLDRLLLIFLEN
jgi:hypothetical protein